MGLVCTLAVFAMAVYQAFEAWLFDQIVFPGCSCLLQVHRQCTHAQVVTSFDPLGLFWNCFRSGKDLYGGCPILVTIRFDQLWVQVVSFILFLLGIVATYAVYEPAWGRRFRKFLWAKLVSRDSSHPETPAPARQDEDAASHTEGVVIEKPPHSTSRSPSVRHPRRHHQNNVLSEAPPTQRQQRRRRRDQPR